MKNGLRQGLFESFWENGKPFIKCTFKDNRLDGLYEEFFENGQVKERCTYKDGLKQGLYESFYENGQVKERYTFKDDQLITKNETLIQKLFLFFLKILYSLT